MLKGVAFTGMQVSRLKRLILLRELEGKEWVGVGVGSRRGASVREKNITIIVVLYLKVPRSNLTRLD